MSAWLQQSAKLICQMPHLYLPAYPAVGSAMRSTASHFWCIEKHFEKGAFRALPNSWSKSSNMLRPPRAVKHFRKWRLSPQRGHFSGALWKENASMGHTGFSSNNRAHDLTGAFPRPMLRNAGPLIRKHTPWSQQPQCHIPLGTTWVTTPCKNGKKPLRLQHLAKNYSSLFLSMFFLYLFFYIYLFKYTKLSSILVFYYW